MSESTAKIGWHPCKRGDYWYCRFYVDEERQRPLLKSFFHGRDTMPLKFFSEKAAQIKCGALNKREAKP